MWETVLAVQIVQARVVAAPYAGWRREVGRRLATAGAGRAGLERLRELVGPTGDFPDFLTPPGGVSNLDEGCEALARTRKSLLSADLTRVFSGTAPGWARSLARGDRRQLGDLVRAVRDCHQLLVGPYWRAIKDVTAAARRRKVDELAGNGVEAMLGSIPGVLHWDGRVLHTRYPEDRTVHLDGRGLTLLPAYFADRNPITWIDAELPPLLVYRVDRHAVDAAPTGVTLRRLASLIGTTRAECLRLLLMPLTTSELAQRLDTSIGTASRQAAILREAGLITSSRSGAAVLHGITPLGRALLAGDPSAVP
jgi:DNA-binding transcriptional ArsR family regulator